MNNILFFGNNSDFELNLKEQLQKKLLNADIKIQEFDLSELMNVKLNETDHLFLNLSDLKSFNVFEIFRKSLSLTSNQKKRTGKSIVILPNDSDESIKLKALASNFDLFMVPSSDLEIFLDDFLNLLFNAPFQEDIFVKAMDLNKSCKGLFPLFLRSFTKDTFHFESSIDPSITRSENIQGPIFSELKTNIENLKNSNNQNLNKSLYSCSFTPALVNKKSEGIKGQILKNDFKHFLKLNKSLLLSKNKNIILYGDSYKSQVITNTLKLCSKAQVTHLKEFKDSFKSLELLTPEIIFFEIKDLESDMGISFEDIPELIKNIKSIGHFNPIIIVLNSPSHSNALRQVFKYEKILAFKEELELDFLEELISRFNFNQSSNIEDSQKTLVKNFAPIYLNYISLDIEINTMSEHFISFYSSIELNPGVTFNLDFPFSLIIKITNSKCEGGELAKGILHKGIIIGLKEEEEFKLRVCINQLISNPNWDPNNLELVLKNQEVKNEENFNH